MWMMFVNKDINSGGIYSIKETYELIFTFDLISDSPFYKIFNNNLISSKMSLFVWRFLNNCLPTISNLIQRVVRNIIFPLCVKGCITNETSNFFLLSSIL